MHCPPWGGRRASLGNRHRQRAREAWRGKVTSPRGIQEWRAAGSPELSASSPQGRSPCQGTWGGYSPAQKPTVAEGSPGCYPDRNNFRDTQRPRILSLSSNGPCPRSWAEEKGWGGGAERLPISGRTGEVRKREKQPSTLPPSAPSTAGFQAQVCLDF